MSSEINLSQLRQELDVIDQEILQAISKRKTLVTAIAKDKIKNNTPLYDPSREKQILTQKRQDAQKLDLPPDFTEDLFRLIIDLSHQVQRKLIRESFANEKRVNITIIGGKGKMGIFFSTYFSSLGHHVSIIDQDNNTPDVRAQIIPHSDLVIISVPIHRVTDVICDVAPLIGEHSALVDITSLKSEPVKTMQANTKGTAIGLHPMFGPDRGCVNRQTIVMCSGKGSHWYQWLKNQFEKDGALIVETTAEQHDRIMAIIQVLKHFSTISFGKCLKDAKVDIEESLRYTSPIYRLEMAMVGRLFCQDAGLYVDIELNNPFGTVILKQFQKTVSELLTHIQNQNRDALISEFNQISDFFGDFKNQAMEESKFIIDKMIERL